MRKAKRILTFSLAAAILAATPVVTTACSSSDLAKLCDKLRKTEHPNGQLVNIPLSELPAKNYNVFAHNKSLVNRYLTATHTGSQMKELKKVLYNYVNFPVKKYEWGTFVPAATISDKGAESYTAIWLRDTVWNIMALNAQDRIEDARECTLSIMKYMATQKQLTRMTAAINDPTIVTRDKNGAMNAVHIRFNAATPNLDDVYENGKPQDWHHKQNDALGLYIKLFIEFAEVYLNKTVWKTQETDFKALALLVGYLNSVGFWHMEDSGAWEEIEKFALSSTGCVVAAYQQLVKAYGDGTTSFATAYKKGITDAKTLYPQIETLIDEKSSIDAIKSAIDSAYTDMIIPSIEKGGESVLYAPSDKEYREADTAMLDLIYPMNIDDYPSNAAAAGSFDIWSRVKILAIVENNNNDYGIMRYKNDTYQSSDYWFRDVGSTNTEEDFIKREKAFVAGSEASWFFDSWMAICYEKVIEEAEAIDEFDPDTIMWMKNKLHYHINKALAFINDVGTYRGNGTKVKDGEISLPESYIVVIDDKDSTIWYRLASPVDPLRWAQSSLILMTDYLGDTLAG